LEKYPDYERNQEESMKIRLAIEKIQELQVDAIILPLFQGESEAGQPVLEGITAEVDQVLDGAIRDMVGLGDLTGKACELAAVYPRGAIQARRVIVVGLGTKNGFDLEGARKAAATAIRRAQELHSTEIAISLPTDVDGLPALPLAQAYLEGVLLALYQYPVTKQEANKKTEVDALTIFVEDANRQGEINALIHTVEAVVSGVALARDLVNMPPNVATPSRMAEAAQEIAKTYSMKLTVGDREWAAARQMGAFLAVAKGAGEQPRFIVLEHNADKTDLDTLVLVGKGITFDTGGISIKPSERMSDMKSDMGGAAAILGTMKTVGMLNLPLHVVGIAPCTENMPDANAFHPADVISASNGKTIEIISTDAEGRLILADALVYAQQYKPNAVIDLATLTGACVIALGEGVAAGLFCNDESLREKLVASGSAVHERVWPLPLWDDYKKSIKSDVADIKNSGGRSGGVGTSAIFLKEFTSYPWAHIDMAGMALSGKDDAYIPAGGTGYGVRLLIDFLRRWEING
jgi:leucyl aminopeptidase